MSILCPAAGVVNEGGIRQSGYHYFVMIVFSTKYLLLFISVIYRFWVLGVPGIFPVGRNQVAVPSEPIIKPVLTLGSGYATCPLQNSLLSLPQFTS